MKKSNKIVYDVELKRFSSYQFNGDGKLKPIYLLKYGEREVFLKGSNNGHMLIEYLDIIFNTVNQTFIPCNRKYKVQSKHMLAIETDPELHIHELTQLHKIMEL